MRHSWERVPDFEDRTSYEQCQICRAQRWRGIYYWEDENGIQSDQLEPPCARVAATDDPGSGDAGN